MFWRSCKWPVSVSLTILAAVSSANGSTVTYSYTGNYFTSIGLPGRPYTASDFVSGYITFASALPPDATPGTLIEPAIVSWSFSDGTQTFSSTQGGSLLDSDPSEGATDSAGDLIEWVLEAYPTQNTSSGPYIYTSFMPGMYDDAGLSGPGDGASTYPYTEAQGVWTIESTSTSEPPCLALLLAGMPGALLVTRMSRRKW